MRRELAIPTTRSCSGSSACRSASPLRCRWLVRCWPWPSSGSPSGATPRVPPAAVALFRRGACDGFYSAERLLYLVLWLLPFAGMILNRFGLPIVPLVILGFGGIALARAASPR